MEAGMKLQITTGRQGLLWVRQGIATFWRQPIAMAGMFFMFLGLMTLASMLPLVALVVGLVTIKYLQDERRATEVAGVKRRRESRLIDERTARCVDEAGAFFHLGKRRDIHQSPRLRHQWCMHRNKVRARQQFVEADVCNAE